jgi:hypothetical protein
MANDFTHHETDGDTEALSGDDHRCYGCERRSVCGVQHDAAALSKCTPQRTPTPARTMRWPCHTIFGEKATRPPDNAATRRLVGEAGIQY